MTLQLNGVWTLLSALITIEFGRKLNRWLPFVERASIPAAVSGGLLLSIALTGLRTMRPLDLRFATAPGDTLLLIFFATLGFGAHLGRLASAGKAALIICAAITLAILAQNVVGITIARLVGAPPAAGLFVGSMAFMGGHGTVTAWAKMPEAENIRGAFECGIGSATLGLVLGSIVAGPVAGWIARRSGVVSGDVGLAHVDQDASGAVYENLFSSHRWLRCLLWIMGCLAIGPWIRDVAGEHGLKMPTFLGVLLAGVVVTNVADLLRRPLDTDASELVGSLALHIFLATAMLTLDWSALGGVLAILLTGAIAQVAVTVLIGVLVVYTLFGRDREAIVACGGFVAFSLAAMPVSIAVMRRLNVKLGETPRALLAVMLGGALYSHTANALVIAALFDRLTAG